jgi:hypothetical protein
MPEHNESDPTAPEEKGQLPPDQVWEQLDNAQRAEVLRLLTQIAHKYVAAELQKRKDDINDAVTNGDKQVLPKT